MITSRKLRPLISMLIASLSVIKVNHDARRKRKAKINVSPANQKSLTLIMRLREQNLKRLKEA